MNPDGLYRIVSMRSLHRAVVCATGTSIRPHQSRSRDRSPAMPPRSARHVRPSVPFPRPGLHRVRRPHLRSPDLSRVVLVVEPLEDRSQPSATDPLTLLPNSSTLFTGPALLSTINPAAG